MKEIRIDCTGFSKEDLHCALRIKNEGRYSCADKNSLATAHGAKRHNVLKSHIRKYEHQKLACIDERKRKERAVRGKHCDYRNNNVNIGNERGRYEVRKSLENTVL